jgi:sirohydrochlorin cobaltochelatase
MRGIVLFAHGAREPQWAEPFARIRERIRAARPEYPIELAFLEIMTPTLEEAIATVIAEGAPTVTVFPLFMAQGAHLARDLPRILDQIRATHPNIPISLEPPIGEVSEILEAIAGWILARAD